MRIFFIIFFLSTLPVHAAEFSVHKTPLNCEVELSGTIQAGDALQFQEVVNECKTLEVEGKIILDGNGLDYMEGIKLGNAIFNAGWTTQILNDGICTGACAYAFLGGRFFGASLGWGTSRKLEFGATLGFNSLLPKKAKHGTSKEFFEFSPEFTLALVEYLQRLRVNSEFLINLLQASESEIIYINTPLLLQMLAIDVYKTPPSIKRFLSNDRAIKIAKDILLKQQPEAWEFAPKTSDMTIREFKKEMLEKIALREKGDGDEFFPLSKQITEALKTKNENMIDALFDEMNSLRVVPLSPGKDAKILKITGLDNIHYYLSKTAYFFIYDNGTTQLNIDYIFLGPAELSWTILYGILAKNGELIYQLYDADLPLWQVGDAD